MKLRNLFLTAVAAVTLAACGNQTSKQETAKETKPAEHVKVAVVGSAAHEIWDFVADKAKIENIDFKIGTFIQLNVRGENLAGKTGDLSIEDEKVDFEYEGNRLENDTLQNYTFKSNNDSIKLKIIEPKNDN